MKFKRLLSLILCLSMLVSTLCFSVYAEELDLVPEGSVSEEIIGLEDEIIEKDDETDLGVALISEETEYVAMVGETSYATIDEAIASWTNGTTLTLLSNVTLSGVIEISSTEMHTLDLGKFTMTAATNKNAISIIPNGRSSASYALDIKADANEPGGISASGGSCIYSKGKSGVKDRPIVRIYGGNFAGRYAINHSGSNGTNCPQFWIYGGTFDQISTNRALLQIYGGTFYKKNYISPDSSAYTRIEGGRFFDINNNMGSALNADKWTYGTSKGNFDVTVYVDEDGYYVVEKDSSKIPDFKAVGSVTEDKSMGQYKSTLLYSKAATEGIGYVSANKALVNSTNTDDEIILYEPADENIKTSGNLVIDMSASGADYTGNVTLNKKDATFTVVFDSENPYEGTVTPFSGYALQVTETMGTIVTRTYSNVEACAKIDDTNYASIEEAIANVQDGETITLLKDIELERSIAFTRDIEFTINGNGKKIVPSATSTETNSAFNLGHGNDDTRATKKYNLKNIVFDGWTTDHVVRLQGTTSVIENCEFINCNQPDGLGLVTLTFADATVKDCTFKDNTCLKAIDINSWGDNSQSNVTIENCVFDNNDCTQNAVVLVSTGLSTTVKNSTFTNNNVVSNINGATLYLGFNTGIKAIDNYFENNAVEISSTQATAARPYRSSGAIFAGFADDNCAIIGNAFINNTLKLDDADATVKAIAYSAYYGAGNISGNYWGKTTDPVVGADFTHEYADTNALALDDYYTTINVEANGDFTLSNLKYIVKDVKLDFVDVTASDAEGEKVYNINITAPGKIINRLNSVDLSFVHTKIEGDTDFEIIASNPEVVINPVDNSPVRYEFHYNGKTDVESDTAETITIGQVKFTGYGEFNFVVDSSVDTNAAHATKNDNNIVDTFVPGGNTEFNYGTFDVSDSDITDIEIAVPTRTLTINITFPNAVENNNVDYQDMTVTIVGGTVNETIALGTDGEAYNFTRELPYNTAYTVTVSGAGYRTARYTVTMTDDKQLNFWNNVMDEAQVVEVGKDSSIAKVTFLAGDIVKDNNINIYDLSAVVSYFGTTNDVSAYSDYAKYDLNRDGVIDSKDVAYVLVSWNN